MDQLYQNRSHILENTSASINRSNAIAIETENVGAGILSELSEQRESLLRTQERLHSATENLSKSRAALNAIRKNILYNKFTLILIILLEIGILIGIIVLKVKK